MKRRKPPRNREIELKSTGKKIGKWGMYYLYIDGKTDKVPYEKQDSDYDGHSHSGEFANKISKRRIKDFPDNTTSLLKLNKDLVKGCFYNKGMVFIGKEKGIMEVGVYLDMNMPSIENKFFWIESLSIWEELIKSWKKKKTKTFKIEEGIDYIIASVYTSKDETIEAALQRLLKMLKPFLEEFKASLENRMKTFEKDFIRDLKSR